MPEANRPQFRNIHVSDLASYRLPLAGFVSILHRISGLLLFVLLPFILYLLDSSLRSSGTFLYLQEFVKNPLVKLMILALSWAYLHHFCAGVRHLFMDRHLGLDKHSAKNSAVGVFVVSIPLAGLIALKLFGVI